ncbi:DUF1501 domain-containing protein [Maribacter sp. 2307ULW6-5]|uniref:DUF1501 domain-containing protein n=1 Tax=Maribacter sp. 2307ULW6-5 TaxID=3386275 RepID=UPI0039BD63BF
MNHNEYTKGLGTKHDLEHENWNRRSFLKTLGFGSAGSLLLGGNILHASTTSPLSLALNQQDNDRVLVLIRLQGGNDGLNTIIPMTQYDEYANYRPTLYHLENQLISLNDEFSIPNFMSPLESMWGDGKMKVVHGVGYENQSLSHFTSSDIWASADEFTQGSEGFLGRHFHSYNPDYLNNPPEKPLAIQIGSIGNNLFEYDETNYSFLVSNPNQLRLLAERGTQFSLDNIDTSCHVGLQKEFLRQQTNATFNYAGVIHNAYSQTDSNSVSYENDNLSKQLRIVARLIKGNLGTKVYLVTLNGFDTHVKQADKHQELMTELSSGVKNFFDDLKATGHDEHVLAMTFSEFGRRPRENGSAGTDHGTASQTMFFGPSLQGSDFVGQHPDITDLDNNANLKFNIDFRDLYATVLSQWMCLDLGQVQNALSGNYNNLDLGFACTTEIEPVDPTDPIEPGEPIDPIAEENSDLPDAIESFSHAPFYNENGPSIAITAHKAMHIDVQLYNMLGQHMGSIFSDFVDEGRHEITVKDHLDLDTMSVGSYIYRITNFEGAASKLILIE